MQSLLEIGKIVRPHGIKGAVKVLSYLDGVSFSMFKKVYVGDVKNMANITASQNLNNNAFQVFLDICKSVEQAELLKNKTVFIDRADYPDFKDKVYLTDLIGTNILDENGNVLGELVDVNEYGASSVLEIKCGAIAYSMPYTENYFKFDKVKNVLTTTKELFEDIRV